MSPFPAAFEPRECRGQVRGQLIVLELDRERAASRKVGASLIFFLAAADVF